MAEIPRLLDQLRRAFDGDPWCGPSLLTNLEGITAAQAAQHPIPSAHSIWEIVVHVANWTAIVRRRIADNKPLQPGDAQDWPALPAELSAASWQHTLTALRTAQQQLLAFVETLPDAELGRTIGATFEPPQGGSYTTHQMLHGVAQHYLYHGGQIALLRKLLK
ncbi:DinB family protein [Hymenobacter properus]|uniref:DinB family protein n=1 Tax=Hymenobacter properus TaxID=2791026 RepID=A0A931FL63_9BACT|nr:DinB family protein [Hymenobacter properus]MBF9141721.1 DinB family protein [Hymenobacter properus]MBR7720530.1 DinB family protein [Microvirga sp. SRT04]